MQARKKHVIQKKIPVESRYNNKDYNQNQDFVPIYALWFIKPKYNMTK